MNKSILLVLVLLCFVACKQEQNVIDYPAEEPEGASVIKDFKQASLDIIYASQDTFMQNGAPIIATNIEKMQTVLNLWPDDLKSNSEPCYMTLKDEIIRLLNLKDGLNETAVNPPVDSRYECRRSINYQYDKKRTLNLWKSL